MKATLTVLGSGTSMGVPTIGCDCAVCHSTDPRDRRTRPSVLIEYAGHSVLIDTTPDFREQAIRENIRSLDAVLYTHPDAAEFIRDMFRYIFDADYKFGGLPQVELRPINGSLDLFGAKFQPIVLIHGDAEIYGFRFGSSAYLTDHSDIPEESLKELEGLDVLFLDALRYKPHPTHSTVEHSLATVARLKPQRAFFTHICHDLPHEKTNAALPANVKLSYDGMKLEFEI